jgi:ubiquinone/menaquinone biosynthesis C-methylase UbiE
VHKSNQDTSSNPFNSEEASENYSNANFLYEQSARHAVDFFSPVINDLNSKIIDLGAGTGVSAKILIENGAKNLTLVDPSVAMLQQAEKKFSTAASYIQAGAEDFATHFNHDVDVIYALNCFHLFGDIGAIFNEIKKASKPNAHFIFNVSMPSFCFGSMVGDEYNCVKANRDFYNNLALLSDSPLIGNTVRLFDRLLNEDFEGLMNKAVMAELIHSCGLKLENYAEYPIEGDSKAQKIIWELISTCLIPVKEERLDFLNNQKAPEKMFFRQAFFDILVNND